MTNIIITGKPFTRKWELARLLMDKGYTLNNPYTNRKVVNNYPNDMDATTFDPEVSNRLKIVPRTKHVDDYDYALTMASDPTSYSSKKYLPSFGEYFEGFSEYIFEEEGHTITIMDLKDALYFSKKYNVFTVVLDAPTVDLIDAGRKQGYPDQDVIYKILNEEIDFNEVTNTPFDYDNNRMPVSMYLQDDISNVEQLCKYIEKGVESFAKKTLPIVREGVEKLRF